MWHPTLNTKTQLFYTLKKSSTFIETWLCGLVTWFPTIVNIFRVNITNTITQTCVESLVTFLFTFGITFTTGTLTIRNTISPVCTFFITIIIITWTIRQEYIIVKIPTLWILGYFRQVECQCQYFLDIDGLGEIRRGVVDLSIDNNRPRERSIYAHNVGSIHTTKIISKNNLIVRGGKTPRRHEVPGTLQGLVGRKTPNNRKVGR